MALFHTSGGGRLGNQILNLIHLLALKNEYKIEIIKINDLFLESRSGSLFYPLSEEIISWQICKKKSKNIYFFKLFSKLFIRFIHLYFYLSPFGKSYKIGLKNNYPKYLVGNNLKKEYSFEKLINEAKTYNVALSGWGLRNWKLVSKHKKKIIKNLKDGFSEYLNFKSSIKNKYLLVHIRRTDFLAVEEFKELNFSDQTWLKGILKLCEIKSLNTVVIFSDANVSNLIFSNLRKRGLTTIIPEKNNLNENFLKLFFPYVDNASSVICNASTLVLSLSFLSHEKIFLPSRKSDFQEIILNNAHSLSPTCLNWK